MHISSFSAIILALASIAQAAPPKAVPPKAAPPKDAPPKDAPAKAIPPKAIPTKVTPPKANPPYAVPPNPHGLLQDLQDQALQNLKEVESNGTLTKTSCSLSNAGVRQDW
jgi:hypothetical protein